jgi:DNA invertase Pin-like site-specific DNA recombinase
MQYSPAPVSRPLRCAIYCRISDDKRGEGLGVQRQEEACRQLADRFGWSIVTVQIDNSISAYSGKPRPAFMSMVQSVRDGEVDVVLAWNLDRLYRRMRELEDYIQLVEQTGLQTHTVMAGEFDLNTAMGRAMARAAITFATLEVENGRDRVIAAKLQAARSGKTSGGNRAYGWNQDGMTLREPEAAIVREVVRRFIEGESWNKIAHDLNHRGVPTAQGKQWQSINVRNVATLKRHYGIREHNGQQYPAAWPPLLDHETWEDLQLAIKRGQAKFGKRTYARKHLLTGFVFCGPCGNRMKIINAQQRDGSYSPAFACVKKDSHGQEVGCGKVKRKKEPVEALVIECLMYRLDTPDLSAMLAANESDDGLKKLLRDHETQSLRLQEILDLYSTNQLTFDEYRAAKTAAQERLDALGRELDQKASRRTRGLIPAGQSVWEAWEKADLKEDLEWQRNLLGLVVDKVRIFPKQKGDQKILYKGFRFNPDRVQVDWKA